MATHAEYRQGRMNVIRDDMETSMRRYLTFRRRLQEAGELEPWMDLDPETRKEFSALLRLPAKGK